MTIFLLTGQAARARPSPRRLQLLSDGVQFVHMGEVRLHAAPFRG